VLFLELIRCAKRPVNRRSVGDDREIGTLAPYAGLSERNDEVLTSIYEVMTPPTPPTKIRPVKSLREQFSQVEPLYFPEESRIRHPFLHK